MITAAAPHFASSLIISLFRLRRLRFIQTTFHPLLPFFNSICTKTVSPTSHSRSHSEKLVSAVLSAVNTCSSVSFCKVIHCQVIKSLHYSDGFIGDCLVSLYCRLGSEVDARKLFDELPDKDFVSWNSWISGISRRGLVGKCFDAFVRMKLEMGLKPNGVTLLAMVSVCANMECLDEGTYIHGIALKTGWLCDTKVFNSLINFYGKIGVLGSACRVFEEMPKKDLVSWNSIIAVLGLHGFVEKGVSLFKLMRESEFQPDQATMVSLLHGCAGLGIRMLGESVHAYLYVCGLTWDVNITTALLGFYAKSGKLNASLGVFREMRTLDRVAWTAMLAAYAVHGHGRKAIEFFELMVTKEGLEPDHIMFTHLLSACSHSGLVDEGKKYFKLMTDIYGVAPRLDHYSCMVDLLSRSGRLGDARELIGTMPMEPNSGVWGALLGACRIYGNIELGTEIAERLLALDPSDIRNYVMLSNIYSSAGLWKDASRIKSLMKEKGLMKNPGCSSIEHGKKIHHFVAGDETHPDSERIYMKLEELLTKIKKSGFSSQTEFVLHDVDEEVKVETINKHSEKLAIAYGLLVKGAGVPLIITKNLRICGDCHLTAKIISSIEKRTIIIRDAKRFHHFDNGACSCRDYW